MPRSFELAALVGSRYSLRCLLFHDIASGVSEFTEGLGATLDPAAFEATIRFVSRHYTPISLSDYLDGHRRLELPPRPVLVTFDDAYASVALTAAPILKKYNVPAVFFVIGSLVGNEELGLDTLICYVANTSGLEAVRSALPESISRRRVELRSLTDVFEGLLPTLSQEQIRELRAALTSTTSRSTADIARRAQLYVSANQLRELAASGFEIGNHTFSHVSCRSLVASDFEREISANKTTLERMTGSRVRAFSVPYGSPADLTGELEEHLRSSGHEAVFLASRRSNTSTTHPFRLDRIDVHSRTDGELFGEIEILPRLLTAADTLLRKERRVPDRAVM